MRRPLTTLAALIPLLALAAPVPAAGLHSLPGSSHTLLLDFDGNPADGTPAWGTPAQQQAVWSAVAGYFAFVNLDVTTDYGGPLGHRVAAAVEIGEVSGQGRGGYASIGRWDVPAHVFPNELSQNTTIIGRATAHEAGHVFGLQHQSTWSADGKTMTAEYNPGDANLAPLMGLAYYSAKADWWVGPTPSGPGYLQDDRAVLLSALGAAPVPEPCYGLAVVGVAAGRRRKGAR